MAHAKKDQMHVVLGKGSEAMVECGDIKVEFNAAGVLVNMQGTTIAIDNHGAVSMQKANPAIDKIETDGALKAFMDYYNAYAGICTQPRPEEPKITPEERKMRDKEYDSIRQSNDIFIRHASLSSAWDFGGSSRNSSMEDDGIRYFDEGLDMDDGLGM
jgi:hypothetical protein